MAWGVGVLLSIKNNGRNRAIWVRSLVQDCLNGVRCCDAGAIVRGRKSFVQKIKPLSLGIVVVSFGGIAS